MYFQSKAARRFSFLLSPAGIVIGYILTLFAVVAGVVAFPFSSIWMGLLCILVGEFFVVTILICGDGVSVSCGRLIQGVDDARTSACLRCR